MNEQQKTAMEHPCFLASETAHPRYMRVEKGRCSTIVTINAGYE
jgi:hypothetical protein